MPLGLFSSAMKVSGTSVVRPPSGMAGGKMIYELTKETTRTDGSGLTGALESVLDTSAVGGSSVTSRLSDIGQRWTRLCSM